jgi:hypothetical protein
MSSEKRMIKINPELFKVSEKNTSRKKREKSEVKIKVKSEKPARNKSLRRSVMKMIREKQQEEYKKLFEKDGKKKRDEQHSLEKGEFHKDFENSLDYFQSLVEKEKEKTKEKEKHNHTLKRYSEIPQTIPSFENVSTELPDVFQTVVPVPIQPIQIRQPPRNMVLPPPPKYGCLKNGCLPTYRNFMNTTRRMYPEQEQQILQSSYNAPTILTPTEINSLDEKQFTPSLLSSPSIQQSVKNNLSEKRQKFQKGILSKEGNKRLKYLKRRKIYKRTFKIGRSQTKPQVSVLISNKTIRNRITTDAQLLKQKPIHEVKQFLVKKGFIKVGTTTPNDVLRKMYESVSLICGEIQNHNPENLLYNFINNTDHK